MAFDQGAFEKMSTHIWSEWDEQVYKTPVQLVDKEVLPFTSDLYQSVTRMSQEYSSRTTGKCSQDPDCDSPTTTVDTTAAAAVVGVGTMKDCVSSSVSSPTLIPTVPPTSPLIHTSHNPLHILVHTSSMEKLNMQGKDTIEFMDDNILAQDNVPLCEIPRVKLMERPLINQLFSCISILECSNFKSNGVIILKATSLCTSKPRPMVLKLVCKSFLQSSDNIMYLRNTCREIVLQKVLEHAHIMPLFDVIETPEYLCLLMDYAANGDVFNLVVTQSKISMQVALIILLQTAQALQYCHANSIYHRDIKLENLFLDSDWNVRVGDWNCAHRMIPGAKTKSVIGTRDYISPEMHLGTTYDPAASEVWALGICLYGMITGRNAEKAGARIASYSEDVKQVFKYDDSIHPALRLLSQRLLDPNPVKRMKLDHLLEMEWIYEVVNSTKPSS